MSDDLFREPTPAEAQLAVLQFMGQHLTGELKELERNLISRNNTLNGMTLQPEAVMRSVAQVTGPAAIEQIAPPQAVQQQPVPQPIQQPVVQQPAATPMPQAVVDPNQLELNFNTSPYTERVFDKLESLERKLAVLADTQQQILEYLRTPKSIKKKD